MDSKIPYCYLVFYQFCYNHYMRRLQKKHQDQRTLCQVKSSGSQLPGNKIKVVIYNGIKDSIMLYKLVIFPAKENSEMIISSTFKVSTNQPQVHRLRPPKIKFQEGIFFMRLTKILELDEICKGMLSVSAVQMKKSGTQAY